MLAGLVAAVSAAALVFVPNVAHATASAAAARQPAATAVVSSAATTDPSVVTANAVVTVANGDDYTVQVLTSPAFGSKAGLAAGAKWNFNVPLTCGQKVDLTVRVDFDDPSVDFEVEPRLIPLSIKRVCTTHNAPPVAQDVTVSTPKNMKVAFQLDATDPDGDTLWYTVSSPGHGSVTGKGASRTYVPVKGFEGVDSFNYTVGDGHGHRATATVTVTVGGEICEGINLQRSSTISADGRSARFTVVAAVPACRDIAVQLAASKVAKGYNMTGTYNDTANPQQRVAGPQYVTLKKGQTTATTTLPLPNTCWVLQIDGKLVGSVRVLKALFLDQRGLSGCEPEPELHQEPKTACSLSQYGDFLPGTIVRDGKEGHVWKGTWQSAKWVLSGVVSWGPWRQTVTWNEQELIIHGCVKVRPAVGIQKWDTSYPTGDRDTAVEAKSLDPAVAQVVNFTVKNNGNEPLVDLVVSDITTSGVGVLADVSCSFPGGATGTTWAGPFAVGGSFGCTGTLPALGYDKTHGDVATVVAKGQTTGTSVTSSDAWYGKTGSKPVEYQCPDNTNPGDLNHDGTANADDCGYVPPKPVTCTPPAVPSADGKTCVVPGTGHKGDSPFDPTGPITGGLVALMVAAAFATALGASRRQTVSQR